MPCRRMEICSATVFLLSHNLLRTLAGSSEALLSGQKPPFRLFVCARNVHDGSPVDVINFVVSEPFVVATPRVRTAAKANIPHVDDHVKASHTLGLQLSLEGAVLSHNMTLVLPH